MAAPIPAMDCLVCGKSFGSAEGLKRHLKRHAGKPYHCTTCSKSFCRKDELSVHAKVHDGTGEQLILCDVCGMSLTTKSSLYNHKNLVHKQKTFDCSFCQKSFASKQNKERHERSHGPSEECTKCRKTFKRLDDHKRLCKQADRKRHFKCEICEKMFLEKKYLKEHGKYKHAPERYQCEKCAHLFAHRKTFLSHTRRCGK